MPECNRTPLRQIFLSQNGAPVNAVYHSRNADTAAFRQISSYYNKVTLYTKFGQLVLRKIIDTVATKFHILRLKRTKFDIRCGSAPDPAGELTVLPQTPWLGLRGPTSKGGEGEGREGKEKRRGREGRVEREWDGEINI